MGLPIEEQLEALHKTAAAADALHTTLIKGTLRVTTKPFFPPKAYHGTAAAAPFPI
jgi:hypothetical protein